MGLSHSPSLVMNGLVLALDAGNTKSYPGSGTTWTDLSGNSNTGTLTNGPTYSSANGGSIVFDGSNDYVDLGTQSNLTGITNLTVCGWSRGSGYIANRYYNTTIDNGWLLFTGALSGRKNGSTYISVLSGYSFSENEWVYTVGVISGDIWSVYVNGILRNSVNAGDGATVFANNVMYMGAIPHFSQYNNMRIPQASVYNRALSAAEVSQNFNALRGRYGL